MEDKRILFSKSFGISATTLKNDLVILLWKKKVKSCADSLYCCKSLVFYMFHC